MELENAEASAHRAGFLGRSANCGAGRPQGVDLFEAMHRGQIKAVWIIGTNPAVSLPNADAGVKPLRRLVSSWCPIV